MMRITLTNHIKVLLFHILGTIIMFLILAFLGLQKYYLISFISVWMLWTLPVLFLHIEYYLNNRGLKIEIHSDEIKLQRVNGDSLKYSFQELKKIVLYKAASLDKGGMPILPLEYYHFARIFLVNGEEIIITCLMASDLEDQIRKIKWVSYERKKVFFASIDLHKS